jgi:spore coat polysaccharide biosynthesis protein SpsF
VDAGAVSACAIVQARMGSSRFPGKMLRDIAGKPLIWHVIHRLQQCHSVSQVILATSDQPADDALAAYVATLGIAVVRGPEKNVLRRFMMALDLTDADIIVRITGDAALIDPDLTDRLVDHLRASGADYVLTTGPGSDCGIDPVTRRTLCRIVAERGDHPAAMEHVTGYLQLEPNFARLSRLPADGENRLVEGARMSVDTPADLAFLQEIYRRLGAPTGDAKFLDALALLRDQPELLAINSHIRQRRPDEKPVSVLIRCDGGHALGLGHVVRCLAIGTILRDRFSAAVTFAIGGDAAAIELVRAQAFPMTVMRGAQPAAELAAVLRRVTPDITLMDLRAPFDAGEIEAVRSHPCRLAVLDDPGPRRLHADIAFYPPSAAALDWAGAKGDIAIGFDWIPLRTQFSPPPARALVSPPTLLILAGGSDPASIGRRFLTNAAQALPPVWRIAMVIGAAATIDPAVGDLAKQLGERLTIHRNVADMASLMARADLALAVFGMTAYELAAVGVPTLLLCLSDDHLRSAAYLEQSAAAHLLGIAHAVSDGDIRRAVANLANDPTQRDRFSENARRLIDGHGAQRIAARLIARAECARAKAA